MRVPILIGLALSAPLLVFACGGGDFVPTGIDDDAGGDATDGAPDSGLDSGLDSGADGATEGAADSGSLDDAGGAEAPCTKNECGGCVPLTGKVGDACVSCGGKLVCDGKDALKCDSPGPKNACGGCATLVNAKGAICTSEGLLGGKCSTAKYECVGTDATKCVDPVTTPAPGTKCGTCKTLSYRCKPDNLSTYCPTPPDDTNVCLGCADLGSAVIGAACTPCGVLACDGKEATKCVPPTPALGGSCGICGSSTYVCAAGGKTSECAKPDDRVSDTVDFDYGVTGGATPDWFDDTKAIALSYNQRKTGSMTSLRLRLAKLDWVGSGTAGTITVKMFTGTPGGTATEVASATAPVSSVPLGSPDLILFTFTTPPALIVAGKPIYFQLTTDAPRFRIYADGGPPAAPTDYAFWTRSSSSASWKTAAPPFAAVIQTVSFACP